MKDITREELISSKEYWVTNIQLKLFSEVEAYMKAHRMNRTQFAEYLGCSKGYVTQLLSGDYDNKLSKLVELSLAIGKVPELEFVDAVFVFRHGREGLVPE
jgi:Helix-turn-helix.